MLGPGDLRLSLGLPSRQIGEEGDPKLLAAVNKLIQVSKRHRKPLMTVSFKVSAKSGTWITDFNLLLATADFINVVRGHQQDLARTKKLIEEMGAARTTSNGVKPN